MIRCMRTVESQITEALLQTHWMTEAEHVTVHSMIKPSGRIGRFFGGNHPVFVVSTTGQLKDSFAARLDQLQVI
jgi:hypothetical protein